MKILSVMNLKNGGKGIKPNYVDPVVLMNEIWSLGAFNMRTR